MVTPGSLLITSEASLSCDFEICCEETPTMIRLLCLLELITDISVSVFFLAVTETSFNWVVVSVISWSRLVTLSL